MPDINTLQPEDLSFIAYLDQLKNVVRINGLFDGSRQENTAEHSWHAALSALILAPYADEDIQINRVIQMLLIHDLIEIEAGDTFVYDPQAMAKQEQAEQEAAEIVFNQLPSPLSETLRALWEEFEARATPEAKFAKSIDRFLPIYSNICNSGFSWLPYHVSLAQVQENIAIIRAGATRLADLADDMVTAAAQKGLLTQ